MKKYNLHFFGVVALLWALVSCSESFTDLTPLGSTTSGNFWQTEADAITASNGLYQHWNDDNMYGRGIAWFLNASDDMVTGRNDAGSSAVRNFTATGNESRISNTYRNFYKIVQRANNIILNVPGMNISGEIKNRVLGEAHFMRAFAYLNLAQFYGDQRAGVPIVTEANLEETFFPRPASVIENYQMIEADLKTAEGYLPWFTDYAAEDRGRPHKDAANAYLAKTYLYWAKYDASKWAEVVKAADLVINSPTGRALINTGNPEVDFASVFYVENNFSSEYIFSVVSNTVQGAILPSVMLENTGWGRYNGWGYFHPTLSLYEAFEEGDHRKKATILEFGDEFMFLGEPRRYYSTNSWTGFQFNKYMDPHRYPQEMHLNPNGDYPTTNLNIPLMRFADVLLMKAEALIMQNQNADDLINQVRNRAGLPSISGADLDDLKQERRVEFAGEYTDRHTDLIRWGDAQAAYAQPQMGRQHVNKEDPDSPYTIEEVWPARNFNPNIHHVWPIPPNDVNNAGIEQNEGW